MKKILLPVVGYNALTCALSNSKIRFLMRASVVIWLTMAISFQLAAFTSSGQGLDSEVTLELKHTTLTEALRLLQNATDIPMVYSPELVKGHSDINLSHEKRTVRAVLKIILEDTDITFVERDNAIVLRKKPNSDLGGIQEFVTPDPQLAYTVSGRITDAVTAELLTGVSVIVKGTTRGTTSDARGVYAIDVNDGEVLQFSFIGFKSYETEVGNRTTIDVSLIQDVTDLKEVQIISTSYFSTTKEKSTMNISKVDGKEIENQPVTSLMNSLIGRMPGVDVTPLSGAAGSAPQIQIRGINSLTGFGSFPLYVVDGVQIESLPLNSGSNSMYAQGIDPLNGLSPADIESIEVLKDAAATAIYGSRGANGVIRITTKRAKQGLDNSHFSLNAYTGVGQMGNKVNLLNREQYLNMRHEAYSNAGVSTPLPTNFVYDITGVWDTTRTTDWQEELLGGTARINDVQGSFTGGNGSISFKIGGGYHKETAIYPGDFSYQRGNSDFSFNYLSLDKKLEASAGVNFGWAKNVGYSSASLAAAALSLPPVAPKLHNADGSLNWQLYTFPNGTVRETWSNPLAQLLNSYSNNQYSIISSASVAYRILKDFKVRTVISYSSSANDEKIKQPIASFAPRLRRTATGSTSFNGNSRRSIMIEPQILYDKNINDHHINAIFGTTYQRSSSEYRSILGQNYTTDALLGSIKGAPFVIISADDNNQYKYVSGYTHIGYDYKNRYLVDLTGRRDGSSRFGPGRKFGNFWAASAGWVFSEETFLKNTLISFGKLRGSYGVTGNDQIGDYQYLNTYDIMPIGYQNGISLTPTALYNSDFAWEETTKAEIGIEIGIINNRIAVEASFYRNRSSNQLVNYRLAATTGFDGVLTNLDATIQNSGFELLLSTKNFIKDKFKWVTTFNLSVPRNKLIKFDGIEDSPYSTRYKVGEPLTIQWLYTSRGVNPETGLFEIEDLNDDGAIDNEDRRFMNPLGRTSYMGVNNTLQIGNFYIDFLIQISNNPISGYLPLSGAGSATNQPVEVLNRWQNDGDVKPYPKFMPTGQSTYSDATDSNLSIGDASFIRLKTASIAYRISNNVLKKAKIQDAKIYLQGQNLFTLTDYNGWDPETGNFGIPPLRIVSIGLQLNL